MTRMLVVAVALLLGAGQPKEDAAMKELENLQGTWVFVTLEVEGMKLPEEAFRGAEIIIKDDTFKSITKEATYGGTVKVDSNKKPKTIDLIFTEGPEKGKTSLGIYELEGDNWKICLGFAGKDRPKEFVTKQGSGHALETLKREKQ